MYSQFPFAVQTHSFLRSICRHLHSYEITQKHTHSNTLPQHLVDMLLNSFVLSCCIRAGKTSLFKVLPSPSGKLCNISEFVMFGWLAVAYWLDGLGWLGLG